SLSHGAPGAKLNVGSLGSGAGASGSLGLGSSLGTGGLGAGGSFSASGPFGSAPGFGPSGSSSSFVTGPGLSVGSSGAGGAFGVGVGPSGSSRVGVSGAGRQSAFGGQFTPGFTGFGYGPSYYYPGGYGYGFDDYGLGGFGDFGYWPGYGNYGYGPGYFYGGFPVGPGSWGVRGAGSSQRNLRSQVRSAEVAPAVLPALLLQDLPPVLAASKQRKVWNATTSKPSDHYIVIEKYLQRLHYHEDGYSHVYLKSDDELGLFERSLVAVNERYAVRTSIYLTKSSKSNVIWSMIHSGCRIFSEQCTVSSCQENRQSLHIWNGILQEDSRNKKASGIQHH
ncbi:hypothetical protein MRX96_052851, partial [Rhipicephalus microplus]